MNERELTRRDLLKTFGQGAAILALSGCALRSTQSEEPRPPNIVFILVDDLGWSDLGCYGSQVYETPNTDRLASEGLMFTDFYAAAPVCSPTRASILTGRYPVRTGITTYLLSPQRDPDHVAHHLDLDEYTLAEALGDKGYTTGYFGKWHLGYGMDHWADKQGFDTAKGGMDLPWAWKACYPDRDPPMKKGHTRFFSPYHLTHLDNGPEGEYLTDRLTTETIRFIEENREHLFFAMLSFHTVHTPLQAKPEVVDRYRCKIESIGLDKKAESRKKEKEYQNNPDYAAMVHHMDENVGRLLQRLDELGLKENTVVVFTSDNGGKGSVTSNRPLKGAKHNLNEGGIRVPLIVRWPGRIEAPGRSECPLVSTDFFPTILDMVGCSLIEAQHRDGISFKPILLGQEMEVPRDAIYWHYPHSRNESAIRMGDFKLLHFHETGRSELYNLRDDIGESKDLSTLHPDLARSLLEQLQDWQQSVGVRLEK